MKHRHIGNLEVSALGLGCMGMTGVYGAGADKDEMIRLIAIRFCRMKEGWFAMLLSSTACSRPSTVFRRCQRLQNRPSTAGSSLNGPGARRSPRLAVHAGSKGGGSLKKKPPAPARERRALFKGAYGRYSACRQWRSTASSSGKWRLCISWGSSSFLDPKIYSGLPVAMPSLGCPPAGRSSSFTVMVWIPETSGSRSCGKEMLDPDLTIETLKLKQLNFE